MTAVLSKQTYLITGGAGFIGANFLRFLLKKLSHKESYLQIIVLDKLTYAGDLKAISDEIQREGVHFIEGDICDRSQVKKIFERYDVDFVVNFAAESHVDRSIQDPYIFLKTNVIGTQNLIDIAMNSWRLERKQGEVRYKKGKKFVQISTDEVYGFLPIDFPDGKPFSLSWEAKQIPSIRKTFGVDTFTESHPLSPSSPYAASKASSDLLALSYFKTYNFPLNITRCSNNYGPHQHVEKLIPMTLKKLSERRNIPVYGDGKQVRDWIYVEDHCRGIFQVLQKGQLGAVYNLGGGCELQNISLIEKMIAIYAEILDGQGVDVLQLKRLISYVDDRLGHDRRYAIDFSKSYREVCFSPEVNFEEGLKKTILWYLKNKL